MNTIIRFLIFVIIVSSWTMCLRAQRSLDSNSVRFVAFGDINLGRTVGQKILHEDIDFPFKKFSIKDDSVDIVFANLESPLSFQNGETVDPKSNIVFTGPPEGATTLKNAGFTVLSTANNHALDYGVDGLLQTIAVLDSVGIMHVGTSKIQKELYSPIFIKKKNLIFAIFAVTDLMNFRLHARSYVAWADTSLLFPQIRQVRKRVDVVILSTHGGIEYANQPSKRMQEFAAASVSAGVNLFLGHHPHVTFGIVNIDGNYIVHSLGNFIFYQPQHDWTQYSYGTIFQIQKHQTGVTIDLEKIIPIQVALQPTRMKDTSAVRRLFQRTQQLSNIIIK